MSESQEPTSPGSTTPTNAPAPPAPARPRGPRRGPPPEGRRPAGAQKLDDLTGRGPNLRDLDASVEDELEAAMAGFDQTALVGNQKEATTEGGRKKGKVIAIHGADIFVDVPGGRSQGMMSVDQFDGKPPAVGEELEFEIEGYDRANGLLLLRKLGAVQHVDWSSVAVGMVVDARVTESNKGGLSVDVNGIRGFLPISHIDLYRVENTDQFINQKLRCLVTEVNPQERNLVVSRRALLERERDEQREKFWDTLAVGQTRSGMVRSLLPFGAFVDLGGADGLIPIGELSWTRIAQPDEVVKEGQKVEVKIIRLDRATHKIGLSLKQLTASPWDTIEQRFYPGLVVTKKITRLAEFGAFVELEPGIEGLCHISELAPTRVSKPSAVVHVDQEVNVKVLTIDKENRRVSLSIKQAVAAPEPEEAAEPETETPAEKAKPRNIKLRGGVGNTWKLPNPGQ